MHLAPLCLAAACATPRPLSRVRFEDRPIVWRVADDRPVEAKPEATSFERVHSLFASVVQRPVDDALAARPAVRAQNVNAVGGVPDSSWFENRHLTPRAVHHGPGRAEDRPTPPFRITSAKKGGRSLGFMVEDARGLEFILKFDLPEHPELKTAADIVSQRLFYALGYHVPEDHVAYFDADQLRIDGEVMLTVDGTRERLDRPRLETLLEEVGRDARGIRGLFSRFVDGEPLGGWPSVGTREDDPNDVVPHQHRRELRGLHTFCAWLDHVDYKQDNRLDVFIEAEDGRAYVRHYLVDFDTTLGVNAEIFPRVVDGFASVLDVGWVVATLPTFGLWTRPWERIEPVPDLRGVGRWQSEVFLPGEWVPMYPERAFDERTRYDDFWAASVLAKVTPAHIQAAVDAARYTDPRAAAYVARVLVERRRALLEHAFSRVAALDRFYVDGGRFCFVDAWLEHGFGAPATTRYRLTAYSTAGAPIARYARPGGPGGRVCVARFVRTPERYIIVKVDTERAGARLEPVEVHLGRGPEGRRVIGVVREGG